MTGVQTSALPIYVLPRLDLGIDPGVRKLDFNVLVPLDDVMFGSRLSREEKAHFRVKMLVEETPVYGLDPDELALVENEEFVDRWLWASCLILRAVIGRIVPGIVSGIF